MEQSEILKAAIAQLRASFDNLNRASEDARSGSNDPQTKSEGKYDTRSTEGNYLADGQAIQAQAVMDAIVALENFEPPSFGPSDAVALGALVRIDTGVGPLWFFLVPAGGGTEVEVDDTEVTLVTLEAPLAAQLLGRKVDASISRPTGSIGRIS